MEDFSEFGFDDICEEEETQITLDQVVRYFEQLNIDDFAGSSHRKLRQALRPFFLHLNSRELNQEQRTEYALKKEIERERQGMQARRKEMDKRYLNSVRLRSERLERLNKIKEEANKLELSQVPLICDGPADIGGTVPMITNSESSEQEFEPNLNRPRQCYVCKTRFTRLHHFYFLLCPECAELNWTKRHQTSDRVAGRVYLLTGGRVKIGFFAVLKLLRAGATVIATSRFPKDAAARYANEEDFDTWKDRLHIIALDLRDVVAIECLGAYIRHHFGRLDGIIHNACQTVRRPPAYYLHLLPEETRPYEELPQSLRDILAQNIGFEKHLHTSHPQLGCSANPEQGVATTPAMPPALRSLIPLLPEDQSIWSETQADGKLSLKTEDTAHFPTGLLDHSRQQVDLRETNSWTLQIAEVSTPEVAETMAINAMAPFVLNSRLIPLMREGDDEGPKFIVNVSAMEGKFYRHKTPNHPHTNMAKAALNMMTRTCAPVLARDDKIFMTSVDTGWINDENPLVKAARTAEESDFQTPIDEVDAAARIIDPIFSGLNHYPAQTPPSGIFLKDYHETEW